jgi:hypothetical protein
MKCAVVSSETKIGQGTTTGEGHYAVKKTVHFLSKNGGGGHHGKKDIIYKRGSKACLHITHLQNLKNGAEGHTNA